MITISTNLAIVSQIAKAVCSNNATCEASTYERIKNNFDDDTFSYFLTQLNIGAFAVVKIISMRPNTSGKIQVNWKMMDVVRGNEVEHNQAYPANQVSSPAKFGTSVIGATFVKELTDNLGEKILIYHARNQGSYNIAFTTDPAFIDPTKQGGEIVTYDPTRNEYTSPTTGATVTASNNSFLGMDLNSLLIPGLILAAFLVLKK